MTIFVACAVASVIALAGCFEPQASVGADAPIDALSAPIDGPPATADARPDADLACPRFEQIANGAFDEAADCFTSDYQFADELDLAGTYTITTNPALVHTQFAAFGDHSTGGGPMLVVNGGNVDHRVWCQSIELRAGVTYRADAFAAACTLGFPAELVWTVDGVESGGVDTLPSTTAQWVLVSSNLIDVAQDASVWLCLENRNTEVSGNDFALDDFALVSD